MCGSMLHRTGKIRLLPARYSLLVAGGDDDDDDDDDDDSHQCNVLPWMS